MLRLFSSALFDVRGALARVGIPPAAARAMPPPPRRTDTRGTRLRIHRFYDPVNSGPRAA
ncbi:hypothetical protein A33M_2303 [Rhodovulum sp. PH10]|nr:hypothetical protein A33M_2303 [Rhodovulum sp. PH10]